MKKILFLIFLGFSQISSAGRYESGNSLYERMTNPRIGDQVYAKGYLIGVVDAEYDNCNLGGVTDTQIFDSVKQYLSNYPERRQYKASEIVKSVMKNSYGCKN